MKLCDKDVAGVSINVGKRMQQTASGNYSV